MSKTFAVVRREYIEIVRKKSFLVGIFLVPALIAAGIVVPVLLMHVHVDRQRSLAIVDQTDSLYTSIADRLDEKLQDGRPEYVLLNQPSGADVEATLRDLAKKVERGTLDAYLYIPADVFKQGEARYCAKNLSDLKELSRIQNVLTASVVATRLSRQGLDPKAIRKWTRRVDLRTVKIVKGRERKEGFGQEFMSSFVFAMMLYMVILLFGIMVMRGVMEEKTSRLVEILLSSVRPLQMMAGKILGIGAASLTQVAVWMAVAVLASVYGRAVAGPNLPFRIEPSMVVYFGIFFILGYFLYATLYAVVGAICESEQDAQQVQLLVTLPLVVPIFVLSFVLRHPDAPASVVLSMVPFFAPMLMFIRINVLTPPAVQIVGSILILVGTIAVVMWAAARIYRVGVLMHGKRATLPEIVRWVRHGG